MNSSKSKWASVCVALVACVLSSPAAWARLVASDPLVAIDVDTTNLYSVSTTDASLSLIGTTNVDNLGALEFNESDGFLYGITAGPTSSLYKISLTDGGATLVGALGISSFEGGLAFAPDGTAYGVNGGRTDAPQLFSINLLSGAATPIAVFDGSGDIDGLGWFGNGLIGLEQISNSLITIDPVTADITTILAVEPIVGGIGGMVLTGEFGYFGTAGPGNAEPGSNELYTFDPATGTHDLVGGFTVGGEELMGNGIGGLAIVPEPATLVLLAMGGVGLFVRNARRR